jgi:hypothetical protein
MFPTNRFFKNIVLLILSMEGFFLNLSLPFQEYGGSMPYKDVIHIAYKSKRYSSPWNSL